MATHSSTARLTHSFPVKEALNDLTPSIIPITARAPTESLLIQSKKASTSGGSKPVRVTIPHGGPHTTLTTAFVPGIVALALEGYTINLPNYTGSMGFGQTHIQTLLGHCGSMDVEDVAESVRELVRRGVSEEGRQVTMGSSLSLLITNTQPYSTQHHSATPSSQWANSHQGLIFLIGFMLNPGFRPPTLTSPTPYSLTPPPSNSNSPTSDAPTPPTPLMTPQTYNTLFTASPIAHVDNITAPVLIFIGEDDLRVVPGQGIGFYHAIKGRVGGTGNAIWDGDANITGTGETGTEKDKTKGIVEMLSFPRDSHGIEGVEAARVSREAMRDWFKAFAAGS
ncbi:Alpha/Beta hydrolase protein [Suillus placidus]|uniref:Dipeptidyl-peptidase V n=1 Tax=Suillus placidus TaxID=48579 RepID=A0A9P6ZY49_9AGAM|nr:Alpha/Beta hydrolase protein [Suillus placidus]